MKMSGICSAHKHHEPGCPQCEALPHTTEGGMKILKVATCGGCGESKFKDEFDESGWCCRENCTIRRYELPSWCPLDDAPNTEHVDYNDPGLLKINCD